MNKDQVKKLYDATSEEYGLPEFNLFFNSLQDEKKRKEFFDIANVKYDIGNSVEEFENNLGLKKKIQSEELVQIEPEVPPQKSVGTPSLPAPSPVSSSPTPPSLSPSVSDPLKSLRGADQTKIAARAKELGVDALALSSAINDFEADDEFILSKVNEYANNKAEYDKSKAAYTWRTTLRNSMKKNGLPEDEISTKFDFATQLQKLDVDPKSGEKVPASYASSLQRVANIRDIINENIFEEGDKREAMRALNIDGYAAIYQGMKEQDVVNGWAKTGNVFVGAGLDMLRLTDPKRANSLEERINNQYASKEDKALYLRELENIGLNAIAFEVDRGYNRARAQKEPSENFINALSNWKSLAEQTKRSQINRYGDITGADVDRMLFDVTEGLETSTGAKAVYNVAAGASEWFERGLSGIWDYATKNEEERIAADMKRDHSKYITEEVLNYGDVGSSMREAEYIPKLVDPEIKKQVDGIMANTSMSRNEKYEATYPLIKKAYASGGIEFFSNPNKGNINLTSKNVLHLLSTSGARSVGNMIPAVVTGGGGSTALIAGLDAAAMKYDEQFREGENNPMARSLRSGLTVGALAGIMDEAAAFSKALKGGSASLVSKPTAIGSAKTFGSSVGKEIIEEELTLALDGDFVRDWKETMLSTAIIAPLFSGPTAIIDNRRSSEMYRQLWYEAGASPELTKNGLRKMRTEGSITESQYNDGMKRVDRMSQIVANMPKTDLKGNPLSDSQKAKYADNLMKKYDAQAIPETLPTKVAEDITNQAKKADEENATILEGTMPEPTAPAAGKRLFNEPNPEAAVIENEFKASKGINTPEPEKITKLDEEKSKTIADAYEQLVDSPDDPEVQKAYQAMADETMDQFSAIEKAGVKVEIWTGEGEPYKNSEEMIKDVRDNKHMYIFSTEEGFGDSPITDQQRQQNALLRDSGVKDVNGKPLLINDIFRFVHDYFGHTRLGNSFGAIGEENAWNVHARMYSPLARRAMTTETRGQNSWVNFNKAYRNPDGTMKKKGDEGFVPPAQRPFAEQKMALLPEEFSNIEDNYSVKPAVSPLRQQLRDRVGKGMQDRVSKASAALASTGVKINMVEDPAEFDRKVGQLGGQKGLEGVFISDTGEIFINKSKLDQGIADGRVIWHEASHPVVNIVRNTNPKLFNQVVSGLKQAAAKNKGVADALTWAETNYAEDGQGTVDDEAVVETIAGIADGQIDINSLSTGLKQSIIEFINSIAKALGLGQILNDTDAAAFKKLAGDIADALKTGRDISDIVGQGNVDNYKFNAAQAKIDSRISEPGVQVDRKEKLPLKIAPGKEQETIAKVNALIEKYPNALTDPKQWKELMSRVFTYEGPDGEVLIPAFPEGLARMASSVKEVSKELAKVSDEQRKLASDGIKGTKEIGKLYEEGKMDDVDTGLYFLWNIMSIGISPYPQESGFLQAVDAGVDKYISAAAEGKFDDAMLEEYLQWVNTALPLGTPGAGSKSNLNSFGTNFLSKASDVIESGEFAGKTRMQALHEIISDRETPTNELRKKWHANMSGMSFNNKIFDFILLTTGRSDLFVVDRVRVDHFWDGDNLKKKAGLGASTSIYDGSELKYKATDGAGFSKMLSDVPGMVFTELANRAMADVVAKAYKKIGVNSSPDVGRFHWETWVAASSQEVSHGSIDAIVQRKDGGKIKDAGIRQGKYGAWDFNFTYRKVGDQPFRYEFTDNNGNIYIFDDIKFIKEEIDNQSKSNYGTEETRFILKDNNGSVIKRETKGISKAWYDQPGVNPTKYFDFLRSKAKEVIPAPDVIEDQGVVIDRSDTVPQASKGNRKSRSESFFDDADIMFPNDHILGGYAVTNNDGKLIGRILLSEVDDNTVKIDEIVSEKRGQRTGNGSAIMRMTIANADKNNVTLTLTPNLIGDMKAKGFESAEKLRNFYSKFGFVRDKGKATMTRPPVSSTQASKGNRLAPNGKPSNLNEKQYQQVRTPEFKNWFGDWENDPANASKVVDENGEPLVVYHGSPATDIDIFDRGSSIRESSGLKELGVYFTNNKSLAELYSKAPKNSEYKKLVQSQVNKLYDKLGESRSNREFDAITSEIDRLRDNSGKVYPVFLNIRNVKEFDADKKFGVEAWNNLTVDAGYKIAKNRDAMEFLKDGKFGVEKVEGIIGRNIADMSIYTSNEDAKRDTFGKYGGDVFLLFDGNPNAIKSATDNSGAFSTTDNRIQASVGNRNQAINQFIRENAGQYSPDEISQAIQDELGISKQEADQMVADAMPKAQAPLAEEIQTFQEGTGEKQPRAMADQFDYLNPETEQQIDEEARTYFAKTNKQTDAEVDKFMQGKNMSDLADYVVSNPNIPARVKIWMAAKVAKNLGTEIEAARANGDKAAVQLMSQKRASIYNEFAKEATELGQAVQAFVAFQNDPSATNFFMNKILKQLKENGVESITDQQKEDITNLLTDLSNAKPGLPKNKAIIALSHYLGRLAPVKMGDVVQAIWYAHILSGVTTQLKNIFANTTMITFELPIGATWQAMKNMSLMPYVYAAKGFGSGMLKGLVKGADILRSGVTEKDANKFMGNEPILEYFSWKQTKAGKLGGGAVGKFLDFPLFIGISPKTLKMVGRALAGADAFFSTAAQEAMANMMAYNQAVAEGKSGITPNGYRRVQELLGNTKQVVENAEQTAIAEGFKPGTMEFKRRVIELTSEVRDEQNKAASEAFGKRVTLTNEPEGFTRGVYQVATSVQQSLPLSRVVIPFTRIVSNISEMIINYSPAGAYRAITGIKNPKLSFKFTPGENNKLSDDERAELFLKSSMAIAGVTLLMSNIGDDEDDWFEVTGAGPNDPKKKYELMKGGWRPYSIKLKDGKYINYAEWPIAGALSGLGAMRDMQYEKAEVKDMETRLGLAAYGYASVFWDKSLLKGLSDFVDIFRLKGKYGPDATTVEKIEKWSANQAKALSMTNFSQQVFKMIQEYNDDPIKEAKGWETLYRDLPVINDGLNPIIDVFGDPVTPSTSERLLPWMTVSDDKKDEMISFLNKKGIYIGIPEEKPFIELNTRTEREMTRDELYRYRKMSGEYTKAILMNRIDDMKKAADRYEGENKQKAWEKMTQRVVSAARKRAYADLVLNKTTDINKMFEDLND